MQHHLGHATAFVDRVPGGGRVPTVEGALRVRGGVHKLTVEQRLDVRRRVKAWKGLKREIYRALATELKVSVNTISRTVLG